MSMPALTAEIEFVSGTWTNVSAWLSMTHGVHIERGRQTEVDDVKPGTLTFTLDNSDGRFSPDFEGSPYWPHVTRGVRVRVTATVNGVASRRMVGAVQSWSVAWGDDTGRQSWCAVTAVDDLALLDRVTLAEQASEIVESFAPVHHWPLTADGVERSGGPAMEAVCFPEVVAADSPTEPAFGGSDESPTSLTVDRVEGVQGYAAFVALSDDTNGHAGDGYVLRATGGLPAGSGDWSVMCVLPAAPVYFDAVADAAPFLGISQGSWNITFRYSPSYGCLFWETYEVVGGVGAPGSVPIPAMTSWPCVVIVSVTLAGVVRVSINGAVSSANLGAPVKDWSDSTVAVGGSYWSVAATGDQPGGGGTTYTGEGGSWCSTCEVGHVATWARALTAAEHASLASQLLGAAGPVSERIERVASWAGVQVDSAVLGTDTVVAPIPVAGATPLGVGGTYAASRLARLFSSRDGVLTWASADYRPAVVTLPDGEVDTALTWETSTVGEVSRVVVTWPDGTSWTYSSGGAPYIDRELVGVMPDAAGDKAVARWLVNTGASRARIPVLPYDLTTLTPAQAALLAGLDVGSEVMLAGAPTQMPDNLRLVVEGIAEDITATERMLTISVSPSMHARIFTVDDNTQGRVSRGFRLGI